VTGKPFAGREAAAREWAPRQRCHAFAHAAIERSVTHWFEMGHRKLWLIARQSKGQMGLQCVSLSRRVVRHTNLANLADIAKLANVAATSAG